ncbi:hypothetical protein Y1Q_0014197 [Alligator mississippiensis]|uniref:Uncharacterized protein n=1 Tax=Alligator mississippiensis TaxID=8496 RepID=A0A151MTZ9_ALLMI|nr:hypothetical protein Y1Q_0014197 [Alligator mississippiensis]
MVLTLLACHGNHCLAQGSLSTAGFPMRSTSLVSLTVPSQDPHCHAAATQIPSCWLDSSKNDNYVLLDATTGAMNATLDPQHHCLWPYQASQDWWLHMVHTTWDNE